MGILEYIYFDCILLTCSGATTWGILEK